MSAPGSATSADVPGRFDVVINGYGYVFADEVEPSLPFRTHRAIYDISQTFVERQNVSNSYGDNAQDFFLTVRQRDWSLGEQQKYFRSGQDGRYWQGASVDNSIAGQVSLRPAMTTQTLSGAATAVSAAGSTGLVATATHVYAVSAAGSIVDNGAHGLAASPTGILSDGSATYVCSAASASNGVRQYNGSTWATFSSQKVDELCYLGNTLYSLVTDPGEGAAAVTEFGKFSTTGTYTTVFTWKDSAGGALQSQIGKLAAFGGQAIIMLNRFDGAELWVGNADGVNIVAKFPAGFYAARLVVLYGIAFVSGTLTVSDNGTTRVERPAVFFYDGSQPGLLWKSDGTVSIGSGSDQQINAPALAAYQDVLAFSDNASGRFMVYNPASGGVHGVGTFTVTTNVPLMAGSSRFFIYSPSSTALYQFPVSTAAASSGYVTSSLIDFESSLSKLFRGISVEWDAASDGDGGTVDISYQVGSVDGSWTALKTGAVSGTEYTLSSVSGHAIAVKVTLNKGTSTNGPVLRSINVRAAPQLRQFRSGTYILDCTGSPEEPRQLRDGSPHPLLGYDQVTNLLAAARSTTPFSVTDRFGTFTALVDLNDTEGFDVYEVHPNLQNLEKPGSYLVRLKVREV